MFWPLRHAGSIVRKRRPIQLTFFVTRRCNARCDFCFYLRGAARGGDAAPELSLEEIRKVSRSMGSLLWLAFSGGEPYLREDLPEVSRIFYEQNRPAIMLYPTNGLRPESIRDATQKILRDCPQSVVVVKLSLDGIEGAHDALRGVPGAFGKVMRSYDLLGELLPRHPNLELGINTVFCSENEDRIDAIVDFVQTLDRIGTHTISLVRGDLAHAHYRNVDYDRYRRAVARLDAHARCRAGNVYRFRGARLKAAQDALQHRLIYETASRQERLTPCYAGRLNLVLSETGAVHPCEMSHESLGNVRDHGYDVMRLIGGEKAGAAIRGIEAGSCHCTHECYFITNILFNPGHYPALAREYFRL
jgi:MoaA/NifB/PqqE/SkfB family radical SAM enzyme